MRDVAFFDETLITNRYYEWIEVCTLNIFYQRHFKQLDIIGPTDICRNRLKADQFGCTITPFPADDLVLSFTQPTNCNRLDNPMCLNRLTQFTNRIFIKITSG